MDFKRTLISALIILLSPCAMAGSVADLYRAKLIVPSQVSMPDEQTTLNGLKQVLVKVSGDDDIARNSLIKQQLGAAGDFLQQYSFLAASQVGQQQALVLDYNPALVDALITRTGKKPLGENRPTVLLWLASSLNGTRDFVSVESAELTALLAAADRRGLPVQLPLYDLEDQAALPVSDLWGLFEGALRGASERYNPDAVIAARLSKTASGMTQIEWDLFSDSGSQRHSSLGEMNNVMNEVVDTAADQLFNPVVSHSLSYFQTGVAVHISNINSYADYVQFTDYLQSLPVVSLVSIERINGSEFVFRLELDGDQLQLQQAMGLDPRIQALDLKRNADGSQTLSYSWQG